MLRNQSFSFNLLPTGHYPKEQGYVSIAKNTSLITRAISLFVLVMLLMMSAAPQLQAQSGKNKKSPVLIPEEIKKKCSHIPFEDRIKVRVARFTRSTSGVDSEDLNNFSTMLSNAMYELDCYRVLAMQKDASDSGTDVETDYEKPQIVVTGEITEYIHSQKVNKIGITSKKTTTAKVGFVLQLKNPTTGEILYSKSFNNEGMVGSTATEVKVRLPGPLGNQSVGTAEEEPVQLAYFDAIEKGILDAVTFLVDNQERIYQILKGTTTADSRTTIELENANFAQLLEVEKALKSIPGTTKVEKSMKDGVGKIIVFHSGSVEDLATSLLPAIEGSADLTGLEGTKITMRMK
jgi:curli biogenesis system outer membrane secretion channel CsgG